ncbi:MAG: hypothetical protein LC623_07010 [Halobacteriales archaeon]|nr:hypothetical protein [Halobacteriales archaeon]
MIEEAHRGPRFMVRGSRLSNALGRQNASLVLLALMDSKTPVGANDLTARIAGFSGSGIQAARHLAEFGLVRVKEKPGVAGRSAYEISLTSAGERVARALAPVADL